MYGYAVRKSSAAALIILPILIGLLTTICVPGTARAQTAVSTIICNQADVTITTPASDSVVSSPTVALTGTVVQSGQIEVYVDGTFDSIIPLNVGQMTYQGTVQLAAGTHTIKLVAVDSCESSNGEATTVVTYTPVSTGSSGNTTQTGVSDGGVAIDANAKVAPQSSFTLLPAPFSDVIDGLLRWLNIAPNDVSDTGMSRFSVWRAVVITSGTYLAIAGAASWMVTGMSFLPSFAGADQVGRRRKANRVLRIVGAVLILIGFLA